MRNDSRAVFGFYRDEGHVEKGVQALKNEGFKAEDISVVLANGAGAAGTLDGLVGALINLAIPKDEALRYGSRLKDGAVLLHVQVSDGATKALARSVLDDSGADDIATREDAAPTAIPPTLRPQATIAKQDPRKDEQPASSSSTDAVVVNAPEKSREVKQRSAHHLDD